MNELIERLAREHFDDLVQIYPCTIEAFTKAVARECADIARNYGISANDVIRERFDL